MQKSMALDKLLLAKGIFQDMCKLDSGQGTRRTKYNKMRNAECRIARVLDDEIACITTINQFVTHDLDATNEGAPRAHVGALVLKVHL